MVCSIIVLSGTVDHLRHARGGSRAPALLPATMSTFTSEPGTRLGGRYRLEDRLAAASGWGALEGDGENPRPALRGIFFAAGVRIVSEAASAIAGAHAAGIAHLCLQPEAVRSTTGGGLKLTGLGIDAALAGITADDPELTDTWGLGSLLYAALTGMWPEQDHPYLPAAPLSDGQPRRPRQVRAGVP